ncbi:MAG: Ppx/GppA family phosphatase [Clostridiaceae bacterium]|nr:Ppx/GppA family phosphatase [Clostridiaceae bacterium]
MKKIAVIDIGSNSVRLVIARITYPSTIEIIDEIKETIRLGVNSDNKNNIPLSKIDLLVSTLNIFKGLCDKLQVTEIIAVATEAIRRAPNKEIILKKIYLITGINVRILSGDEEAYYDFLGIKNSMPYKTGLILDIGGCSSEFIYMNDNELVEKVSIPFGALGLTEMFNLQNTASPEQKYALEQFLINIYKEISWLKNINFQYLIGIGGSFRCLGNIHRNNLTSKTNVLHNYKISSKDVDLIYLNLINKSLEDKKQIKGLTKERADIFLASIAEISTLIQYCDIKEVIFSTNGLREGLINEYMVQYCIN